jgi:CBS domain-containing protein
MLQERRVRDVMGSEKAMVAWSDTADAALGRMRGLGRERLAVIDPYGVIGICERSVLMDLEQRGSWLGSLSVADLVRRGPFWCRADDLVEKVKAAMDRLRTDVLAVIDRRGRVIGTIHRSELEAAVEDEVRH